MVELRLLGLLTVSLIHFSPISDIGTSFANPKPKPSSLHPEAATADMP